MSTNGRLPLVSPFARFACLVLASLMAFAGLTTCEGRLPGQLETVTVAVPPLEQNALLYIAAEQGYFTGNGLQVTVKNYDSGPTSINAVMQGGAELAETAEFPVVRAIFQKSTLSVIAANDKFENDYLVARKDRGIEKVADLKGKQIGVARQTINEFYLGRFLALNGISPEQVALVDLQPAEFVSAISGGRVDAIIAWQPYIHQMVNQQSNIVVWPAQSNQSVYGLLVGRTEWITAHPDTVVRFIQSLKQAEDYAVSNRDQAKMIVQKRLNYEASYVAQIWAQHNFALSLDFSLIAAMTDEAHWIIDNQLTTERAVPDFQKYIYTAALKTVKPDAVNIPH